MRVGEDLIGTYLVDMNAMFFGMPMALFPAIAKGYGGAEVLDSSTPRRRRARSR